MQKYVIMHTKEILVDVTTSAVDELNTRASPITIEMELIFGSLIEKRIHVRENQVLSSDVLCVEDKLYLSFSANILSSSSNKENEVVHDIQPIMKLKPYVPKWLLLDWKQKSWIGEFSFDSRKSKSIDSSLLLGTGKS